MACVSSRDTEVPRLTARSLILCKASLEMDRVIFRVSTMTSTRTSVAQKNVERKRWSSTAAE